MVLSLTVSISYLRTGRTKGQTYKCRTRSCGALLSLPHGGHREDVIHAKAFEYYIRDHVVDWFTWAQNNKLGVERMEDLILVTGCTLVTSWAAAAFDNYTKPVDATSISLHAQKFDCGGAQFLWSNVRGNVEYHNSQFDLVRSPGYVSRHKFIHRTRIMKNENPFRGISASSSEDSEQSALSFGPNTSGLQQNPFLTILTIARMTRYKRHKFQMF
jgi:hypothetical protein